MDDELIRQLVSGSVGAFVGAWAAFAFERFKRKKESADEQLLVGVEELTHLVHMAAWQDVLWKDITAKGKPKDWTQFPTPDHSSPRAAAQASRLSFLILDGDANVVSKVAIEVANHINWIDNLNVFASTTRELWKEFHDKQLTAPNGDYLTVARARCDPRLVDTAEGLHGLLLAHAAVNVDSAWKTIDELREALKRRFPSAPIPFHDRAMGGFVTKAI